MKLIAFILCWVCLSSCVTAKHVQHRTHKKAPVVRVVALTPTAKSSVNIASKFASSTQAKVWLWPAVGVAVFQPIHPAVQITSSVPQPVRASATGQVVFVRSSFKHLGGLIILKHPSQWLSIYAHVDKISVRMGDKVSSAQIIGEMSAAGHKRKFLAFTLIQNNRAVNPLRVLQKNNSVKIV